MGPYLGIKLAVNGDGFSFCWEGGVGVGAGLGIDPTGGLDPEGFKAAAEVGTDVLGFGVSGKLERQFKDGPCGGGGSGSATTAEVKACAGIVCGKVNQDGFGGLEASLGEIAGVEAQAKATLNYCTGGLW